MGDKDELDDLLDSTLDDLEEIDKKTASKVKPPTQVIPKPTPSKPTPSSSSSASSSSTTTTSTATTSSTSGDKSEEELAENFASEMVNVLKAFQGGDMEKSIEELVKNMGGLNLPEGVAGSSSGEGGNEDADLSKILSAFATLDAQNAGSSEEDSTDAGDSEATSISDKLKKIAERAKNIGDQPADGEELDKMLHDFESNPEFQSVMEGMVNQMISKDVLYEPMKELREKYPKWLSDNHSKLSEEEYGKYITQYDIVQKICIVYEACGENASAEQIQEVVQLMQDMAEYGQPPQDIIKELAPGVQIGDDGVPVFPPGAEGSEGGAGAAGCSIM